MRKRQTPSCPVISSTTPQILERPPPMGDQSQLPKRARASKPKVKSGCITCKTRRVKCDEARPFCLRCRKFGRNCDGYAVTVPKGRGLIRLQPRIPMLFQTPSISIHRTEDESRYFRVFVEYTADQLSGFLDSAFWDHLVLQESHNVPAIRHSVIALGALSKSLQTAPSPGLRVNDIEDVCKPHYEQAVLQHLKAIQALNQYISSPQGPQLRNALVACVLFICFETFQGNQVAAVQQTYGGLGMLRGHYQGAPGPKPWKSQRPSSEDLGVKRRAIMIREEARQMRGGSIPNVGRMYPQEVLDQDENRRQELEFLPIRRVASTSNTPAISVPSSVSSYDPDIAHTYIPNMAPSEFSQERNTDMFLGMQNLEPLVTDEQFSVASSATHSFWQPALGQPPSTSSNSGVSTPNRYQPTPAESFSRSSPDLVDMEQFFDKPPGTDISSQMSNTEAYNLNLDVNATHPPSDAPSPQPKIVLQSDLSMEKILIQTLVRLETLGLFFNMAPGFPPLIWDIHNIWVRPIPSSFPDFTSAQLCWDFLMNQVLKFYHGTIYNRNYAIKSSDPPEVIAQEYQFYIQKLEDFWIAFKPHLNAATSEDGNIINPAALILSLYVKATMIALATISSPSEMVYDATRPAFKYIVEQSTLLMSHPTTKRARFSFAGGIVPPLHVVTTKCRDPIIRRKAIALLFSNPRQEGGWDGILIARIGTWMMGVEEKHLPPPPLRDEEIDFGSDDGNFVWPIFGEYDSLERGATAVRGCREYHGNILIASVMAERGESSKENSPSPPRDLRMPQVSHFEQRDENGGNARWVIPEEKRVELLMVDFHIPERYLWIKCQKTVLDKDGKREEMETIMAW